MDGRVGWEEDAVGWGFELEVEVEAVGGLVNVGKRSVVRAE